MIKKIAKYNTVTVRYIMDKADYEDFKVTHEVVEIISQTDEKITIEVLEHRYITERYEI